MYGIDVNCCIIILNCGALDIVVPFKRISLVLLAIAYRPGKTAAGSNSCHCRIASRGINLTAASYKVESRQLELRNVICAFGKATYGIQPTRIGSR